MVPKIFTPEDETRQLLLAGTRAVYEAVKSTYSPRSGNIGIELNWGNPVVSHDGVTVARAMADKDGRINAGMRLVIEASEQTNRNAGDGTSATVILTHKLFEGAVKLVAAGYNPMEIKRGMDRAAIDIVRSIDGRKKIAEPDDLRHIAAISSGDDALGNLIADTIIDVGDSAGVTIEESNGINVESQIVDGFHFGKGVDSPFYFNELDSRRAAYNDCWVLATNKKIQDVGDIKPILTWLNKQEKKNLLIIGYVSGFALEIAVQNKLNGVINVVSVAPPALGEMAAEFLDDAATITGGKLAAAAYDFNQLLKDADAGEALFGWADRVVVTQGTTTIIGGAGTEPVDIEGEEDATITADTRSEVEKRIDNIRKQLESSSDSVTAERLEGRIAKLHGKIGVIQVGGNTESERKERLLRVEDAVMATRAAREDGYVAGGATTLLRIGAENAAMATNDEQVGYNLVYQMIQEPFHILLNNAGITDIGYQRHAVINAEEGYGYNVRDIDEEPIDLYAAGIVDPAKVVKEAVRNAVANAGVLTTMNGLITFDVEEIRKDKQTED